VAGPSPAAELYHDVKKTRIYEKKEKFSEIY